MNKRKLVIITALSLALAGCSLLGRATPTASPTAVPGALSSATPLLADTDTPAPAAGDTQTPIPPPTTLVATDTPVAETDTPAANPSAAGGSTAAPGPTEAGSATAAVTQGAGTDQADFVADVNVPDGTAFTSGQAFVKTWQLKNSGSNAWTTAYDLVFVRGDQMGGPATLPLSQTVAPGATVNISVNLTAPGKLGTFTGFWMLRNAAGALFGIGTGANQPIYVKIAVGGAAGTPLPTTVPGSIRVNSASLAVQPASFSGACPQNFTFTGTMNSTGAGKVSYRLEATSDKPGFVFDLPAAVESTFTDAGPRTFSVNYQLTFTGSVSGQATLHVLTPNDLSSQKVSFSLTCATAAGTPTP